MEEHMKATRQTTMLVAALLTVSGGAVFAQGRGQANKATQPKEVSVQTSASTKNVTIQFEYNSRDREVMQTWYRTHENNLPRGLAKRDRLPPGLEKHLRKHGTLPPGLQKKITPVPVTLVRQLPPPPPGCNHVVIGGNIVLVDTKTFYVHAVFRF
jgi:hypothetical protein